MTGGLDPSEDFLQPQYPINSSKETAFFRKGTFNSERVIDSLQRKSGVWLLGYVDTQGPQPLRGKLTGHAISNRHIAFSMVLNNGVDYYLDNHFQMNTLLQNYKGDVDLSQFSQTHLIAVYVFYQK